MTPMTVRERRPADGMSLIEVLVSLVVAGLFLALLLPGASAALQRMGQSGREAEAVQIARNQVEALSVWPAVVPTPSEGKVGGLLWKVEQIGVERPPAGAAATTVLRHFRITVVEGQGQEPLVSLTLKRLGRAS
jgi:prepilin-type N-terminal cleavage/methylation domain-containing protein